MLLTNLRKVGGSVMLAVPPAILDLLHLDVGATVTLAVEGERLIVETHHKPQYTLTELLEAAQSRDELTPEDREWVNTPAVGRELL